MSNIEKHEYEVTIEYNGEELKKLTAKGFSRAEIMNRTLTWRDEVTGFVCHIPTGSKVRIKKIA